MVTTSAGRPRQIGLEDIIQAALALGIDSVSMRALARRLGVSSTALYRHVDSRQALVDACMDQLCANIPLPSRQLFWRDYLRALGLGFFRALQTMPGMAAYGMRIGPSTPAAFDIIDASLGVLRHHGFAPAEAMSAYSLVVSHGFEFVQRWERYMAARLSDGSGGYKVMELEAEQLASRPHLAEVLAQAPKKPNWEDIEVKYLQQLHWILAGITLSE